MNERLKNLDSLFHPRSIAFVGATESTRKWGFIILNNLITGGWKGSLYPVNPGRDSILGYKAYPTVRDIPDEVDLAVFTIPAKSILPAIEDCVAKGIKTGVIITAGFKEMGGEYIDIEARLIEKAREGNMLLVGPNCQGICCPGDNLFPWMPNYYPRNGSIGVVSQSGNILNLLIGGVVGSGLGVAKCISSGNEADLKTVDYYDYFAGDSRVDVILSYVEGLVDGRNFIERTRAITPNKPVIVLKGGRTSSGISAARSHTGAIAVSDNLFDAACKQSGVIRAHTIDEAGILAASFTNRPLPRGNRVAIITGGGGLGVIASDVCSDEGLKIADLSGETLEKIGELLPDWWVPGNPVDLVAGLDFSTVVPMMEILIKSGDVDSIILAFMAPPRTTNDSIPENEQKKGSSLNLWKIVVKYFGEFSEKIVNLSFEFNIPIYPVFKIPLEEGDSLASNQGERPMAIYENIETACKAVGAMTRYYDYKKKMARFA